MKNEEANLARCLSRLGRFAEVIVVDSGSEDATCRIASENGARLVHFAWDGSFPKKRNWVLLTQELKSEWVLFLDADDLVTDAFCDEAALAIQRPFDGFWLSYTNYFLGRPLNHGDTQRKLALFSVGKGLYERIDEMRWSKLDMEVHEHPIIEGAVGQIAARIDHRDMAGILKFIDRHRDYAEWEARRTIKLRADGAEALSQLTRRQRSKYRNIDKWWFAPSYFLWTYFGRLGFLDGSAGFSYAAYKYWYFQTIRLLIRELEE